VVRWCSSAVVRWENVVVRSNLQCNTHHCLRLTQSNLTQHSLLLAMHAHCMPSQTTFHPSLVRP
jgi:hypothetical protein